MILIPPLFFNFLVLRSLRITDKNPFVIQVHRVPVVLAPPKKTSQKYVTQPPCKKVPLMMCVIKILIMHCSGCPNISKRRRSNKNPVLKTNTVVWAEFQQQFPVYPTNIHHCRERNPRICCINVVFRNRLIACSQESAKTWPLNAGLVEAEHYFLLYTYLWKCFW